MLTLVFSAGVDLLPKRVPVVDDDADPGPSVLGM